MTDSSPKSDHEAEKTSLDGSNATSSKAEGRGSQLQEFNIPCLTAFGLRVDQEKIALVAGAGEMLPYPESTPVLTLGRGKKKTRKISLMTNEELKDSFSGILNDSQLLQQKEIQEWSGACFSALALEASNFAARSDQAHSKQPPIVFDGLLDLETKSFQRPDASVHDWSTKNKLNLTVNTRLQPSRYGDFSQVAQAQMSSFSHQQPDFREIPFQNFNLPLDLINRGMDSAPAVFPNTASLKNGYYKSLKGHLLPTPPHSAGWLEPQNQFERPATMTCHEQFQVGYCNSHAKGVMEVKPKFGIDIGLFDSLPTPNSATFSSVHTPDSAAFQQSDVSFPLAPNVEFPLSTSSYLISHKLNSPTTTGGLPLTPLDIGTTFGDNTLPLNIFDQETQTCKNTFSLHQAPLSNITNEYTKQISGQKRVIQATDEYGNTRELKRNALTCDIFQNSYENLTQLKEDTSVTLAKKGSFGTRLKPGPKSKSTLIQHPPPLIHIGRTGGPGESGGIPKDILKCFYEPIHQSSQDTEGILTINKRYVCKMESCGRLFPRKTAIESHIQTHLEDKPFVCPVRDCNAAFVRQHDLRRHEHIHSGKKPFNCECGKGFARGDALMRHRQRGICVGSMVPRRC
ncbi:expressed protein [Phakopsora pachyrhizi]|uniref:Expressed protein n=1 Tax=Phakopsora pachyrhizi TaxID=170000 RepID=A0AAV0BMX2_PHAPC|nr:expressed protein [Phakopsora pachyrhizi]